MPHYQYSQLTSLLYLEFLISFNARSLAYQVIRRLQGPYWVITENHAQETQNIIPKKAQKAWNQSSKMVKKHEIMPFLQIILWGDRRTNPPPTKCLSWCTGIPPTKISDSHTCRREAPEIFDFEPIFFNFWWFSAQSAKFSKFFLKYSMGVQKSFHFYKNLKKSWQKHEIMPHYPKS